MFVGTQLCLGRETVVRRLRLLTHHWLSPTPVFLCELLVGGRRGPIASLSLSLFVFTFTVCGGLGHGAGRVVGFLDGAIYNTSAC